MGGRQTWAWARNRNDRGESPKPGKKSENFFRSTIIYRKTQISYYLGISNQ